MGRTGGRVPPDGTGANVSDILAAMVRFPEGSSIVFMHPSVVRQMLTDNEIVALHEAGYLHYHEWPDCP